ncbi:MAG: hypothetical protein AAF991_10115, partial [Pseudomonadota bacterium]
LPKRSVGTIELFAMIYRPLSNSVIQPVAAALRFAVCAPANSAYRAVDFALETSGRAQLPQRKKLPRLNKYYE